MNDPLFLSADSEQCFVVGHPIVRQGNGGGDDLGCSAGDLYCRSQDPRTDQRNGEHFPTGLGDLGRKRIRIFK
jgi:hypothetical protein